MLEIRPIVVNDDMVVLGGNMRLRACQKAGLKEVPIIKASDLTEEQQQEFIIKDNVGFGSWDWDMIANEWDVEQLEDWGLEMPLFNGVENEDEVYSRKIKAPTYKPENDKPNISDLYNSVYNILLKLPEETTIYPGHHYGHSPTTTFKENKQYSPFFNCKSESEFITVMENYERNR